MSVYASNTTVSVEKSRAEIEATLGRYGAERFAYATEPGRAAIQFVLESPAGATLAIRMVLPLPSKGERRFTHRKSHGGRVVENDPAQVNKLWEQACRSSWRSLCLVIKAKLEACAAGISTVEREFLADVLLPGGETIGERVTPDLKLIGQGKNLPPLLGRAS